MTIEEKRVFLAEHAKRQAASSRARVQALQAQVTKASTYAQMWEFRQERFATMDADQLDLFVADITNFAAVGLSEDTARHAEWDLVNWIADRLVGKDIA